jgi:tetratricopeptide (TPR) repeat protein
VTGCKSVGREAEPPPKAAGAVSEAQPAAEKMPRIASRSEGDPAVKRTSYQRKITNEQRYNVHLELAQFQESQENFELALNEYQQALEACESHVPQRNHAQQALAHRRMGAALDRLGRFEQSEVHYKTALKLSPNDPKVWNDAGYSYYIQSRWADSLRALKTADSLDPNNSRVLTNLGLVLAATGKTDEALAAFTRAGGNAVGHTNLAYILAAMGKEDLALQHYQKALQDQPDLAPAKEALAALAAKTAQTNPIAAIPPPVPASSMPVPVAGLKPSVTRAANPVVATTPLILGMPAPAPATTRAVASGPAPVAPTPMPPATTPTRSTSHTSLAANVRVPTASSPVGALKPAGTSTTTVKPAAASAKIPTDPVVGRTSASIPPPVPPPAPPMPGN